MILILAPDCPEETLDAILKDCWGVLSCAPFHCNPRIAERAKAAGVTRVAFDRAGFKYHGRVKALAEAAREGGLEF